MRRMADRDRSGFILSLLINMIFRLEWPVAALILLVIWKVLKLKLCLMLAGACLGLWVIISLFVTLVLSAVANMPEDGGMLENREKQDRRAEEIRKQYLNKK